MKERLAAAAILLGGVALAWGFRNADLLRLSGEASGFWLGALLVAVGAGALVFGGTQVVVVDPERRLIRLEARHRFGVKVRELPFADVSTTHVAELGDREGGSPRFHVIATLNTGEEVALFVGYFEGAWKRSAMEERRTRLEALLARRPG
jgi:hypothetical protein